LNVWAYQVDAGLVVRGYGFLEAQSSQSVSDLSTTGDLCTLTLRHRYNLTQSSAIFSLTDSAKT